MTSKVITSGVMLLLLSLSINLGSKNAKSVNRDINDSLLDSIVSFSMQSGGEILSNSDVSSVYSPLSLYNVLCVMSTLTSVGSDSYYELSEVLQIDKNTIENEFLTLTKDISDGLKKCGVSNSLWYDNKDNIYNEEFLKDKTKKLGVTLKKEDFKTNGPSAFAGFIKKSTAGLIDPNPSDFDYMKNNNFALLNTLYYDGTWAKKFDRNHEITFVNDHGVGKGYTSISKEESVYCYSDARVDSIRMNYKDGAYMIMIKPTENSEGKVIGTINDILNDYSYLSRIINNYRNVNNLTKREINIDIPKFEVNATFDLNNHIQSDLGIKSIYKFNNKEFSPMLNNEDCYFMMTDIKQMSYIKVDEKGTKAAAATFSFGCGGNMAMQPEEFIVDRPTAYIIISETDIPLFMGVIRNVGE